MRGRDDVGEAEVRGGGKISNIDEEDKIKGFVLAMIRVYWEESADATQEAETPARYKCTGLASENDWNTGKFNTKGHFDKATIQCKQFKATSKADSLLRQENKHDTDNGAGELELRAKSTYIRESGRKPDQTRLQPEPRVERQAAERGSGNDIPPFNPSLQYNPPLFAVGNFPLRDMPCTAMPCYQKTRP